MIHRVDPSADLGSATETELYSIFISTLTVCVAQIASLTIVIHARVTHVSLLALERMQHVSSTIKRRILFAVFSLPPSG